ncbi:BrxA family protein [Mangrovimonas sp. DI 80]|uniref:BrxA family protein n=1 Tax=Mangrovimonas sp. DI 80 TaxID=1779330 RepID=UPI000977248F|nr:BrxA family protein [Mangrovimonas sp. DI 80]OMP32282.1 hypothetical protein BKM32_04315 [Mangrovimonas sp. DI 80]
MIYNTDINIVGSIPDYHLIYKALPLLYDGNDSLDTILIANNEFNLRTEKSRKRFLSVLNSAFVHEDKSLNEFISKLLKEDAIDEKSKAIILFWVFSINNQLFRELNNNVFLKYYYQGRAELPSSDIEAYLKDLISRNEKLKGKWSDITISTIASKYLTVLKKLNLLEGRKKKTFCFVRIPDELIVCLIHLYTLLHQEGSNFLEHEFSQWMFISKESILERLKKIAKKDWLKMNYTGSTLRVESGFDSNSIIDGIFRRS